MNAIITAAETALLANSRPRPVRADAHAGPVSTWCSKGSAASG